MAAVKPRPGSYALVFHCDQPASVAVGRLGTLQLEPGYYVYCGSAFGPGGVKRRTDHHRAISRRPHWHLDYLRPFLTLREIWHTYDSDAREHQWAAQLVGLRGAGRPFPGFGSSDCRCISHLIRLGYKPSVRGFSRRMHEAVAGHSRIYVELVAS